MIEMAPEGRCRPVPEAHRLSFKQKSRAGRTEACLSVHEKSETRRPAITAIHGETHHAYAATCPVFRRYRTVGAVYRGYAPGRDPRPHPGQAACRGTHANDADGLGPRGDPLDRNAARSSRRPAASPGRPLRDLEDGRAPGGRGAVCPGAAARGADQQAHQPSGDGAIQPISIRAGGCRRGRGDQSGLPDRGRSRRVEQGGPSFPVAVEERAAASRPSICC